MTESQSLLIEVFFPTGSLGEESPQHVGSQSLLIEVFFPTFIKTVKPYRLWLSQSLLIEVFFPTGKERGKKIAKTVAIPSN